MINTEKMTASIIKQLLSDDKIFNRSSLSISVCEDGITLSIFPMIEEESSEEEAIKQYCDNDIEITKQIKTALDSIYEKPYRWIPVNELCPESGSRVIVCRDNVIDLAYYTSVDQNSDQWWSARNASHLYFTPKYWMPIPKLPKEV